MSEFVVFSQFNDRNTVSSGLIGGVLALQSFQEYFGLDKKSAQERADLSGNIVSVLQAGCL